LSLSVGERDEWDAWRTHLGCPVMTVRVYDVAGDIRRASVAEAVIDGCRISVELVEDVSTGDVTELLDERPGGTAGRPPVIPNQLRDDPTGGGRSGGTPG
jgi:hypothetical protein